ncbi:MAG: hypothetical protein JXQ73_18705 [Phycisphaerae bacterium]|nr:hypothetical protein [Phycisphaerae bacterium]
MPTIIKITAGNVSVQANLNDSPTAQSILQALPIAGRVNRWGDEIYFRIDVQQAEADDARTEMAVGELAYWPPGQAFCIFWGPTPASTGPTPVAASNVNPIGRIDGDATILSATKDGDPVTIESVEG